MWRFHKRRRCEKTCWGGLIDLVVTDPPYNVNYQDKAKKLNKHGYSINEGNIQNDAMTPEEFVMFLDKAFRNLHDALKMGGVFYIWHSNKTVYEFEDALKKNELQTRQQLIWVKNTIVIGRQDYQWKHEPCLYGWKDGAAHYFVTDRSKTTVHEDSIEIDKLKKEDMAKMLHEIYDNDTPLSVIYENKPSKSEEHPTMKPVKLIARLIANSSRKGEKVLDLFGGSGTTLIASEQLGRQCYMMEYDPHYVDVIIDRYEKLTGKKAKKIKG